MGNFSCHLTKLTSSSSLVTRDDLNHFLEFFYALRQLLNFLTTYIIAWGSCPFGPRKLSDVGGGLRMICDVF